VNLTSGTCRLRCSSWATNLAGGANGILGKGDHLKTVIVVLNWNSHEITEECIESLLAMEGYGGSFEILIVDNGSRDGSVEALRAAFPNLEVIANSRNLGFTGGCNVGMRRALGQNADYVLLVNNDTIVKANFLGELLTEVERSPKVGMVSPKIYYFDQPDRIWWAGGAFSLWQGVPRHIGRNKRENGEYETARDIDWATGCGVLLKCDALREGGLFDEEIFSNGEDLDLSLRLRELGWRIRYAPAAKMWHKEGFATRRNVGEHVRYFTAVRNNLWVMHKHARPIQWVTFWPSFLVRYVLVILVMSLCRGDLMSARATLDGIAAFFRMRTNPHTGVLPEELIRTTVPAAEGVVHTIDADPALSRQPPT
jgi:GT2 family glycosyltransferase